MDASLLYAMYEPKCLDMLANIRSICSGVVSGLMYLHVNMNRWQFGENYYVPAETCFLRLADLTQTLLIQLWQPLPLAVGGEAFLDSR